MRKTILPPARSDRVTISATPPAQAQTYKVLYSFTGSLDGSLPQSNLARDTSGSLYGTTGAAVHTGKGPCLRLCLRWIRAESKPSFIMAAALRQREAIDAEGRVVPSRRPSGLD